MNATELLAHFERIGDAPDAIPRLRRFVLDLAVRGKLVPQEPKDEPAPELLKRITAEKARLAKAGKISPSINTGSSGNDSLLLEIPRHWCDANICDVLHELQTGPFGSSLHQHDYRVGGTPVINPASIQDGKIVPIAKMAVGSDTCERLSSFRLRAGDIVMARRGEMGRCALVAEREVGWLCGTGSLILRPSPLIFGPFLVLLIGSPFGQGYLGGAAVGTTMQNLNQTILLRMRFGLPPLAEQHRIVAKVDELMALCDRLEAARAERETRRDRLTSASLSRLNTPDPDGFRDDARFALEALPVITARQDQIKQLRQTILNLAVRGKLVRQDPKDEPAAELLKRIAKEREAPREFKKARRNGESEISSLREGTPLPVGWLWTNIDEIALSMRYGTSTKCEYAGPGIPVLRIPNVSSGVISLDDIKFGPLNKNEANDLRLNAGDLLMIRSNGSLDIVGRSAIVSSEAEGMAFAGYLVRLRLSISNLSPEYVWLAMNSTAVRDQIERPIRSAVGLKNVNLTEFGALTFPLPPLAEQHRIVVKVNQLMALCDRLEAALAGGNDACSGLLNAALTEALRSAEERDEAA